MTYHKWGLGYYQDLEGNVEYGRFRAVKGIVPPWVHFMGDYRYGYIESRRKS